MSRHLPWPDRQRIAIAWRSILLWVKRDIRTFCLRAVGRGLRHNGVWDWLWFLDISCLDNRSQQACDVMWCAEWRKLTLSDREFISKAFMWPKRWCFTKTFTTLVSWMFANPLVEFMGHTLREVRHLGTKTTIRLIVKFNLGLSLPQKICFFGGELWVMKRGKIILYIAWCITARGQTVGWFRVSVCKKHGKESGLWRLQ